ncbi:MAG: hypothetical protein F4049_05660 [Gemmatimonadetes bacterium]|nr:hypothetical protein [Gemmatimonadota bacterium]
MLRIGAYRVFVHMAVREAMAFRAQFLGSLYLSGLFLLLSYYLWSAVYGEQEELAGIHIEDMMTYLVVSALVQGAVIGGTLTTLGENYVSGSIGTELIRPLSFPLVCFARTMGSVTLYLILRGLPVFLLGAILLTIQWPAPTATIAFLISLAQALVVYFLLEFTLAQLTLFTETHSAAAQLWGLIVSFATGSLIPLPFFPDTLRAILFALPFQSMFYTPINIFLGGTLEVGPITETLMAAGLPSILAALLCQTIWIVLLVPVAAGVWRFSSQRLVVQGG